MFVVVLEIMYPVRSREFLMATVRGSIMRLKRRHDSGSPCLTPCVIRYGLLRFPLMATG